MLSCTKGDTSLPSPNPSPPTNQRIQNQLLPSQRKGITTRLRGPQLHDHFQTIPIIKHDIQNHLFIRNTQQHIVTSKVMKARKKPLLLNLEDTILNYSGRKFVVLALRNRQMRLKTPIYNPNYPFKLVLL